MVVELKVTSPASLCAVFRFGLSRPVRIELDIGFIGDGECSETNLDEIIRIIEGSRYHQRLDPACSDCDWYQVLELIRRCHDQARFVSGRLITSVRIEDGVSTVEELQCQVIPAESAAVARTM